MSYDNLNVTTTSGEIFTTSEHELLAGLVLKRFGWEIAPAAAAWRRLLQNSCTDDQFRDLAATRRGQLARTVVAWNRNEPKV